MLEYLLIKIHPLICLAAECARRREGIHYCVNNIPHGAVCRQYYKKDKWYIFIDNWYNDVIMQVTRY